MAVESASVTATRETIHSELRDSDRVTCNITATDLHASGRNAGSTSTPSSVNASKMGSAPGDS